MPLPLALGLMLLRKLCRYPDDVVGWVQHCFEQSILRKSVGVRWQEYDIRHRCWSVVTRRDLRSWRWKKSRSRVYREMPAQ